MLTLMECPWERLSLFFPVYNEAAALVPLLDKAEAVLDGFGLKDYEIIVVDDGSTDSTPQLLIEYMRLHPKVRAITHEQNRGYGAALVSGIGAARFEWLAYSDGDGQFDVSDLARFFAPSTKSDVVLGYRRRRSDHIGRRINATLWGMAVWLILGLEVKDVDCGFKLFKTQRLRELGVLKARGAVISAEILTRLRAADVTWQEVAVEHYERQGGSPTGARLRVIARALHELWWLRRYERHGRH